MKKRKSKFDSLNPFTQYDTCLKTEVLYLPGQFNKNGIARSINKLAEWKLLNMPSHIEQLALMLSTIRYVPGTCHTPGQWVSDRYVFEKHIINYSHTAVAVFVKRDVRIEGVEFEPIVKLAQDRMKQMKIKL